jgi:hypothetical protein
LGLSVSSPFSFLKIWDNIYMERTKEDVVVAAAAVKKKMDIMHGSMHA